MLLNTNFEFYQGATLGGDYDLRGFRNERFWAINRSIKVVIFAGI
jgi:hypothetical protein